MSYIGWIIIFFILAVINTFIASKSLKDYLAIHKSIDGIHALDEFKGVVKKQMIQALVQVGILFLMGFFGGWGIISGRLSFNEFMLYILLNIIIIILGQKGKKTEKKARTLRVDDKSMEEEYADVCATWVSKPFPDF